MSRRSIAGSSPFRDDPLKDRQEYDPEAAPKAGRAKDRAEYERAMAGRKPSAKLEPGMGSTAGSPPRRDAEG
jgi:hypothetical protein